MKSSDFDKYIKDNSTSNLSAPDELKWENMDIQLPKKKKRRFYPIVLALFIGVAGGLTGLYFNSSEITSKTNPIVEQIENSSVDYSSTENIDQSEITFVENKDKSNTAPKKDKTTIGKSIEKSTIMSLVENNSNSISTQLALNQTPIKTAATIEKETSKNQLLVSPELEAIKSEIEFEQSKILLPQLPDLQVSKIQEKNKKTKGSLMIFAGVNFTQNQFHSNNPTYSQSLEQATLDAWGQSLSLKKYFPIRNSFFFVGGASYHRLHSTFDYSKYLGFTDASSSTPGQVERIHRTRIVHQNNYQEFAELNLGLGKQIPISRHFTVDLSVGMNPSYKISERGMTIDELENLVSLHDLNRRTFNLSANANLNFNYNFNRFSLIAGGRYAKFLSNISSIEKNNVTNRPSIFNLNFGIQKRF